jgi:hypothetical protein
VFVSSLAVIVDLAGFVPGVFELAVRREGDGWRTFQAVVR